MLQLENVYGYEKKRVRFMVFNATFNNTFNNISVISWWSVLLVEKNRGTRRTPLTYRKSQTNFRKYMLYSL